MKNFRLVGVLLFATAMFMAGEQEPGYSRKLMKVSCVQLDVSADLNENTGRIIRHIENEAGRKARLVVFPECALTSYDVGIVGRFTQPEIDAALDRIRRACRKLDIYAVVGSAFSRGGAWYNGAYVIDPQGHVIKRYAKMHVVKPFFKNGDELAIFRIDGVPATIMICHDERYPEIFRIPVLAGARIGICISSESKRINKRDDYRSQIMARAAENQIYVIHCNEGDGGADGGSHGHSRVIDPRGKILAEAGSMVGDVIRAAIHPGLSSNGRALSGTATPSLRQFWDEGLRVLRAQNPEYFVDPE